MTPEAFDHVLRALARPLPPADDRQVVDALERQADATPDDPAIRGALLAAHARFTAEHGLRPIVAGIQRARLVRWTPYDATWTGTTVATGFPGMVRTLRPAFSRDPLLRRQLRRDVQALAPMIPGIALDDEGTAITAPLPGPRLHDGPPGGAAHPAALARMLLGTVHHMTRWHHAGLGLHDLDPEEIRDCGDHLVVVSLTPRPLNDDTETWRRIAAMLNTWWHDAAEHPLGDLVQGWTVMPPAHAHDAAATCLATVAEHLADARHGIMRRTASTTTLAHRDRLDDLVRRLDAVVPPPTGRAAVGTDLEGQHLAVISDGDVITWGPLGDDAQVLYDADGFDVPIARRLVRARGTAPISQSANDDMNGDIAFADAVTRWVSASLELRTIQLLLDATSPVG